MKESFVHVVWKNERWTVETEGKTGSGPTYKNRDEAVEEGKRQAKQKHVELLIHRQDGTIGERDSYGNDPHNIPG